MRERPILPILEAHIGPENLKLRLLWAPSLRKIGNSHEL
jgi:hypothetical protein